MYKRQVTKDITTTTITTTTIVTIKNPIPVIVGWDVSTNITGMCVLHAGTGRLIDLQAFKLKKKSNVDLNDKADQLKAEIQTHLVNKGYDIKGVYVEAPIETFSPHLGTTATFVSSRFNQLVCYVIWQQLSVKPALLKFQTLRSSLGIKLTKGNKNGIKPDVLQFAQSKTQSFPWDEHKRTNSEYHRYVYDMADAYVIAYKAFVDYNSF